MSLVTVTHDQAAEGIRQAAWASFCAKHGLAASLSGDTWYSPEKRVQVIREGRRRVSFVASRTHAAEAARLAVACWAQFGGRLTASPEIAAIIAAPLQQVNGGGR